MLEIKCIAKDAFGIVLKESSKTLSDCTTNFDRHQALDELYNDVKDKLD